MLRKLGSRAAVAREIGCSLPALDAKLGQYGVRQEALEAVNRWKVENEPTAAPKAGEPVSDTEVLEQENRELRAALTKSRKEDVREERVIRLLADLLPVKKPRYRPAPVPKGSGKKPHTLVLLWSDLHAGEVVSADETNGANSYNWEVMLRRHDELRRGVLSFRDQFAPVDELVILALGDMLSGGS